MPREGEGEEGVREWALEVGGWGGGVVMVVVVVVVVVTGGGGRWQPAGLQFKQMQCTTSGR